MRYPKEKRARTNNGMNRAAAATRPTAGPKLGSLGVLLCSTVVSEMQFRTRKATNDNARDASPLALSDWNGFTEMIPSPGGCRPAIAKLQAGGAASKNEKAPNRGSRPPCLVCSISLRRGLADRDLQRAHAVDAAFDLVARLELRHAGRGSRHDDIAGGKRDLLRELPDDLRHVPDQLREVTLLGFGAVHGQPDLALGGVTDLGGRLQRRAGRGIVERLADLPGTFLLARGNLQVAA